MTYPHFKNKHLEQALFNPSDYVNWRKFIKKGCKKAPKKYIIIYYPQILRYFKRNYKYTTIKVNRQITIHIHKNVGVVQITGIGSPHATTVVEELIAFGGKEFLNIGSAGGLKGFGTFLCERAIRDEGTSHHYQAYKKYAYPDKELTERLLKSLLKKKIAFKKGTTWTIDAPYRETKAEIQRYKKQGVNTVEMEASALFTAAKVRKVKIAAAFAVSDVIADEEWDPQFGKKHVNQSLYELFSAAMDCLLSRKKN